MYESQRPDDSDPTKRPPSEWFDAIGACLEDLRGRIGVLSRTPDAGLIVGHARNIMLCSDDLFILASRQYPANMAPNGMKQIAEDHAKAAEPYLELLNHSADSNVPSDELAAKRALLCELLSTFADDVMRAIDRAGGAGH